MKFSCTAVFKYTFDNPKQIAKYEERVVMTEASSFDEAEKIFLSEFQRYATDGVQFLNIYEINEVLEDQESPVTEISSSMRIFEGSAEKYLEQFWYDQKPESCENVGWHHVWYNHGVGKSRCYNCQEEREDKLW